MSQQKNKNDLSSLVCKFEGWRAEVHGYLKQAFTKANLTEEQIDNLSKHASVSTGKAWLNRGEQLVTDLAVLTLDPASKTFDVLSQAQYESQEGLLKSEENIVQKIAAQELTLSVYKELLPKDSPEAKKAFDCIERNILPSIKQAAVKVLGCNQSDLDEKIKEAKQEVHKKASPGFEFVYPAVE